MAMLHSKLGSPDNAKCGEKFDARNVRYAPGLSIRIKFSSDYARTVMDEPKRPEPEIAPPVPKTQPKPGGVEIPPDKDTPEKRSPASGVKR
jgi:hypothetical protein